MVVALSVLTAWIVIRGKASSAISAGKLRSRFERPAYNSCRNRHCPKCQSLAKVKWLDKQKSELLPTGYFHLVFTLPHELNPLILVNKKSLLNILFQSVSQTLAQFAKR